MEIVKTKIEGVLILKPTIHIDKRGFFSETYNKKRINLKKTIFVQDNISHNKKKFTFRGLHYQSKPFAQAKLIRVEKGEILDFILDIRPNSKTYKKLITIKLSDKNLDQIFIPKGLAHGFLTLKDSTRVVYKVDRFYSKKHDKGYNIKDKFIKIKTSKKKFILSNKDVNLPFFSDKIKD